MPPSIIFSPQISYNGVTLTRSAGVVLTFHGGSQVNFLPNCKTSWSSYRSLRIFSEGIFGQKSKCKFIEPFAPKFSTVPGYLQLLLVVGNPVDLSKPKFRIRKNGMCCCIVDVLMVRFYLKNSSSL